MKNLLLLMVVCLFVVACEKTKINEETSEIENLNIGLYQTDKGDIVRPGDDKD
jgi:hypothetical protein